jgi:hypothetical protein
MFLEITQTLLLLDVIKHYQLSSFDKDSFIIV